MQCGVVLAGGYEQSGLKQRYGAPHTDVCWCCLCLSPLPSNTPVRTASGSPELPSQLTSNTCSQRALSECLSSAMCAASLVSGFTARTKSLKQKENTHCWVKSRKYKYIYLYIFCLFEWQHLELNKQFTSRIQESLHVVSHSFIWPYRQKRWNTFVQIISNYLLKHIYINNCINIE